MKHRFNSTLFCPIFFFLLIVSVGHVFAWPFAYISNSNDDTVSVIDVTTRTVSATIPVGIFPWGVAVHPDGTYAYVTNYSDDTVSVIDTATNAVSATIPVGASPRGVAAHPDGTYAYVANFNDDTVSVIHTAKMAVFATIPIGGNPGGVAVHPDGTCVYAANANDDTVSVIDTATNTVSATIPVGMYPHGVAVHPDGTYAYATNHLSDTVSVILTATNSVSATIPVGGNPDGVAIHPDGTYAYAANFNDDTVSVIHTATNAVSATISVGDNPRTLGLFVGGPGCLTVSGSTPAVLFDDADDEDYSPSFDWLIVGEGGASDSDADNMFTILGTSETSDDTVPIVTLYHDGGSDGDADSVDSLIVEENGDVGLCDNRFYFDRDLSRMGIGTSNPEEALHVEGNIYVAGNMEMGSSRRFKEDIRSLETREAVVALKALRPVKFRFKKDPDEESVGFIAEEVPDLVAANGRKALSPMDIVAVLTRVVQKQQRVNEELSRRVTDLEKRTVRTGIFGP